jgi:peptidyl-prolyl cis-trans isomerase D
LPKGEEDVVLNVMRDNLKHLKWVLWIVALSMLLYLGLYFNNGSTGGRAGGDWAARVDGVAISSDRFLDAARRQDDAYRRMLGPQYDQLKTQLHLGTQVVQQMVNDEIMRNEARKLGLDASPAEVTSRILADPSFHDQSGQFIGKERYTQIVGRAWRGGVADYERTLADAVAVEKWMSLVTEPARVTDQEVERLYRARNDKAAIDYVVVPKGEQPAGAVSDAELAAYYQQHADRYRQGEGKRIRYILVDRQAQVGKVPVTDEEVRGFYQANQAEFQRPEQRRASQVLFRFPPVATESDKRAIHDLAESVRKRVDAGEDIASLAKSMSQDTDTAPKGGDMGWLARGQGGPVSEAVFATPVGKAAPVVQSDLGFHVVKVTEQRAAGPAPFEEVRDFLKKQLEIRKAQDTAKSEADRIRKEISSAADLDSVAAKEKLQVQERVVSRDDPGRDLGPSPEFLQTIAGLPPGEVSNPLPVARGMAIAAVKEMVPAVVPPLDQNRERVRTDVLNERAQQAAVAAAKRALAQGKDLQAAASSLKQTVKSSGDLSRGQAIPEIGSVPELDTALFGPGTKAGDKGVVAAPGGGALVYVVTRRDTFDPAKFASGKTALQDEVMGARKQALLQAVLEELRGTYKVEINPDVVGRVDGSEG